MIHRFDGRQWRPGPAGQEGSFPFPAHAQADDFFNDVSGAIGRTPEAVAETLLDLMMKQGSAVHMPSAKPDWRALADDLRRCWGQAGRDKRLGRMMGLAVLDAHASLTLQVKAPWPPDLVQRAAQMALRLLRVNGQLAFLREQAWFTSGAYETVLQIESQVHRDRKIENIEWHKDTDGTVLFSNLVFCNEPGLPATEWSVDLQPMAAEKRARVERQWPPELLAALDGARETLRQRDPQTLCIEGGTLPADGFVSWVDELVWHASPLLKRRNRWCLDDAIAVAARSDFTSLSYDFLVQLVQTTDSATGRWMAAHGVPWADLGFEEAASLWQAIQDPPKHPDLKQAVQQDLRAIDWSDRRLLTGMGFSLIQEQDTSVGEETIVQPTGLVGRPRRNSEDMSALRKAPASQQSRDFMQVLVIVRRRA